VERVLVDQPTRDGQDSQIDGYWKETRHQKGVVWGVGWGGGGGHEGGDKAGSPGSSTIGVLATTISFGNAVVP